MKPKSINDGAWSATDNLLNLRALVRFCLHQIENSTPSEFADAKNEWCTMLYLMKENVDAAYDTVEDIGVMARRTGDDAAKAAH